MVILCGKKMRPTNQRRPSTIQNYIASGSNIRLKLAVLTLMSEEEDRLTRWRVIKLRLSDDKCINIP